MPISEDSKRQNGCLKCTKWSGDLTFLPPLATDVGSCALGKIKGAYDPPCDEGFELNRDRQKALVVAVGKAMANNRIALRTEAYGLRHKSGTALLTAPKIADADSPAVRQGKITRETTARQQKGARRLRETLATDRVFDKIVDSANRTSGLIPNALVVEYGWQVDALVKAGRVTQNANGGYRLAETQMHRIPRDGRLVNHGPMGSSFGKGKTEKTKFAELSSAPVEPRDLSALAEFLWQAAQNCFEIARPGKGAVTAGKLRFATQALLDDLVQAGFLIRTGEQVFRYRIAPAFLHYLGPNWQAQLLAEGIPPLEPEPALHESKVAVESRKKIRLRKVLETEHEDRDLTILPERIRIILFWVVLAHNDDDSIRSYDLLSFHKIGQQELYEVRYYDLLVLRNARWSYGPQLFQMVESIRGKEDATEIVAEALGLNPAPS